MAWADLADARLPGQEHALADEAYVVGQVTSRRVYLRELPVSGSVAVAGYTAISGTDPAPGQFYARYEGELAGTLEFHASADGAAVQVSYSGRGGVLFAHLLNGLAADVAAASRASEDHAARTLAVHGIADTSKLVLTDDARLFDARPPVAHGASHAKGSDTLPLSTYSLKDFGTRSATDLDSGNLAYARLPNVQGTWNGSGVLGISGFSTVSFAGNAQFSGGVGFGGPYAAGQVMRADRPALSGATGQIGLYMFPQFGADATTYGRAIWARAQYQAAMGELSLFYASPPLQVVSGTGSISTLYGLRIDALTQGATNYAVYTAGTTPSVFGGRVAIGGTAAPNAAASLDLVSTTGFLLVPTMTTAQRDAVSATPPNRAFLYNSDVGAFQGRAGGNWVNL